jgi:aspartyl-tRNA(Asn)/glutamyl-tRNA(Gln) amidotransferase subunit B
MCALLGGLTTGTPTTARSTTNTKAPGIAGPSARPTARRHHHVAATGLSSSSSSSSSSTPMLLRATTTAATPGFFNAAAGLLGRGASVAARARSRSRGLATTAAAAAAPAPADVTPTTPTPASPLLGYETVVGIETHVQLQTRTKAFCRCPNRYGDPPNTNVCPVCLGHPGALPVYSGEALRLGALMGVALGARVAPRSRFDRKQYFYADLPKGYQISQHEGPLCSGGAVVVDFPEERGGSKKKKNGRGEGGGVDAPPPPPLRRTFGVTRAHLEEDAGKSVHGGAAGGGALTSSTNGSSSSTTSSSLVDFNRAGVPLLEIVSEPDMRSGRDAAGYAAELRRLVRSLGVSDGDMSRGSMRCDVNVSIRPRVAPGQPEHPFGTKVEVKNLNSFANIQKAVDFEATRQAALLDAGRGAEIVQETRLWDEARGETVAMRRKEGLADYRYFPEPDLPEIVVDEALLSEAKARMPAELPLQRRDRYLDALGLPRADALQLADEEDTAAYFDACLAAGAPAKAAANWIMGDVQAWCKEHKQPLTATGLPAAALAELLQLIETEVISGKIAKDALPELLPAGGPVSSGEAGAVRNFVESRGLVQVTDRAEVERMVDGVLAANKEQLDAYAGGKAKLAGFFTGQVMKVSEGRVSPALMNEVLQQRLKAAADAAAAAAAAAAGK